MEQLPALITGFGIGGVVVLFFQRAFLKRDRRQEWLTEMLDVMGQMRVNAHEYGRHMARLQALGGAVADPALTTMLDAVRIRGDFVAGNPNYEAVWRYVTDRLAELRSKS